MALCVYFNDPEDGCTGTVTPPRRLCEQHLRVFCHTIGSVTPDTMARTFMPVPEFAVTLARLEGRGVHGLSARQINLLRGEESPATYS